MPWTPSTPTCLRHATLPLPSEHLIDGPGDAAWTVALAHGAGAPMDSPFMEQVAAGLGAHGIRVVRFEFPYMARRRSEGTKAPPDRAPVLLETWRGVIEACGPAERLAIGGKSMGGRMASLVADEAGVAGLLVFGFPFHAPGKVAEGRIGHLADLATPTMIVQGTRDALGSRDEVADYALSSAIELCWIEDGDHSLKPRKASGHTYEESMARAVAAAAGFVLGLSNG